MIHLRSFISARRGAAVAALALASALAVASVGPAVAISQVVSVPVGTNPSAIELRPDGLVAFVANSGSNSVSAVSLVTLGALTIPLENSPYDLEMRPGTTELWVTNYAAGSITIIDTTTLLVVTTFASSPSVHDIAFTADGSRAFVSIYNSDVVIELTASTRALLDVHAVGDGPTGMVVDAERDRLVVAAQDGDLLSFVNLTTDAVTSVPVGNGPGDLYLDAARDRVYVSQFFGGSVGVVDLVSGALIDTIVTGSQPTGMGASFDGRLLFVGHSDRVRVIDLLSDTVTSLWTVPGSTFDVVMAPDGRAVYSVSYSGGELSIAELEVDRISGADRYATALALSTQTYPSGSDTVFVASGTSFPDALSISSAVALTGGPLLLTAQSTMRADVLAEVERLNPTTIYIAGGTGVISTAVETQLQATGADVVRLSGGDRYATSRAVIAQFFDNPGGYSDLYLVTGSNFPDALSAGAAAGVGGMPMLLVDGSRATLPTATLTLINALQPDRVVIVGGTGVMSTGIQSQIEALPGVSTVRAAGADRYSTSRAVTAIGFDSRTAPAAYWATGAGFPDALSGITIAGESGSPLLLVSPTCVPDEVLSSAWRYGADRIGLIGGTGVLSLAVENLERC